MVLAPKLFCFDFESAICCGSVWNSIVGTKNYNWFKGLIRTVMFLFVGVYIGFARNNTYFDKDTKADLQRRKNIDK